MATSILAPTIDIHTGGQDHIQVHHNNEIAQSEGATGKKPYVRYWLHNAFLTIEGEKISKSLGNTYTLDDVKERGIHPLALRYLFLQAHYRTPLSFSWESLQAADTALHKLWKVGRSVVKASASKDAAPVVAAPSFDDLKTPAVLDALWTTLSSEAAPEKKHAALIEADRILGLSLTNPPEEPKVLSASDLPLEVQNLAKEREEARNSKDFTRSDELRIHIEKSGYHVTDGPSGQVFTKV